MTDWKQAHANACNAATAHPLVEDVIAELLGNLGLPNSGLPRYGAMKVAHYAAMVARAQVLRFDPELLRLAPNEANEEVMRFAAEAVGRGVPVHVVEAEEPTP